MTILNKKAMSIIEYSVLFIIIIGAFLVMRNYIQRGIYGNWGQAGKSFAFGRQYDPQKTIECAFDEQSNQWYDHNCFQSMRQGCNGDPTCEEGIMNSACSAASQSSCQQLNNGAQP